MKPPVAGASSFVPRLVTSQPIAVFDSGLGGLTVLRALRARLPQEDFFYFADARYLALLESTQLGDTKAMGRNFAVYMQTHGFISAVVYVSAEGHTVVDSSGSPSVYVGDREYFRAAKIGREALVSGLVGRT